MHWRHQGLDTKCIRDWTLALSIKIWNTSPWKHIIHCWFCSAIVAYTTFSSQSTLSWTFCSMIRVYWGNKGEERGITEYLPIHLYWATDGYARLSPHQNHCNKSGARSTGMLCCQEARWSDGDIAQGGLCVTGNWGLPEMAHRFLHVL